jgi:vacuolar protein sorting-associated protein 41
MDPNDVQLRNFSRPLQAVALSPDYKKDRNYLSGGQAGNLVLTTGGQAGRSANATTTGAAAAASGWLGSIGLGSNTGTDKILHSGEGIIGTIKWSLSGKYVLWVNEQGIKIMRSNLYLDSTDAGFEWKRMSHKDKPNRDGWEDMAGVWKARAEWFDRDNLEIEEEPTPDTVRAEGANGKQSDLLKQSIQKSKYEEVVVGWGDTVWLFRVHPGGVGTGKEAGERKIGRVEVITMCVNMNQCLNEPC